MRLCSGLQLVWDCLKASWVGISSVTVSCPTQGETNVSAFESRDWNALTRLFELADLCMLKLSVSEVSCLYSQQLTGSLGTPERRSVGKVHLRGVSCGTRTCSSYQILHH